MSWALPLPAAARIPESRIAALARFANRAKVTLIIRMPAARRLTTLAAFVHSLEATAQDDVLEVLEILLHELFGDAEKADKKTRLRTLKDLDGAAATRRRSPDHKCKPLAKRLGEMRRPANKSPQFMRFAPGGKHRLRSPGWINNARSNQDPLKLALVKTELEGRVGRWLLSGV